MRSKLRNTRKSTAAETYDEPFAKFERYMDKVAMMRSTLLVLVIAVGLLCGGCRSDKHVGEWKFVSGGAEVADRSSFTFKKDGTFAMRIEKPVDGGAYRTEGSGTYSWDKDKLTLNYSDYKYYVLQQDGSTKGLVNTGARKVVETVKEAPDGTLNLSSYAHNAVWALARK